VKTFLVGGAVRDKLLGIPVVDRDWVVVGATREQMLAKGFLAVGSDFPVFLHPKTKEEYALARLERKVAAGYTGFEVSFDPSVTLEEDLLRRDLTINAIAESSDGQIIDPYHGCEDIKNKILRHVSPAFIEDPLRVLRIARFAAKLHPFGFKIAPETATLIEQISASGELQALKKERIWKEIEKSLALAKSNIFFQILRECQALVVLMPELDNLWNLSELIDDKSHLGTLTMAALEVVASLDTSIKIRYAVLCHALSCDALVSFSKRIGASNNFTKFALQVNRYLEYSHDINNLSGSNVLKLLQDLNAFQQPDNLTDFLLATEAIFRSKEDYKQQGYPQAARLQKLLLLAKTVTAEPFLVKNMQGKAVGEAIKNKRIELLEAEQKQNN